MGRGMRMMMKKREHNLKITLTDKKNNTKEYTNVIKILRPDPDPGTVSFKLGDWDGDTYNGNKRDTITIDFSNSIIYPDSLGCNKFQITPNKKEGVGTNEGEWNITTFPYGDRYDIYDWTDEDPYYDDAKRGDAVVCKGEKGIVTSSYKEYYYSDNNPPGWQFTRRDQAKYMYTLLENLLAG